MGTSLNGSRMQILQDYSLHSVNLRHFRCYLIAPLVTLVLLFVNPCSQTLQKLRDVSLLERVNRQLLFLRRHVLIIMRSF